MMRFSFLDHHHRHHQEDLHAAAATAPPPPPPPFHHEWNQTLLLSNGVASSLPADPRSTTATQELGFHWPDNDIAQSQLPSPSLSNIGTDHHQSNGRSLLHDHSFSPGTGCTASDHLSSNQEDHHQMSAVTNLLQDPSSMGNFNVVVSPSTATTAASSEYLICSPQNLGPFSGSFSMDLQHMNALSSANWLGRSFYQASVNDHHLMPAALLGNNTSYGNNFHLPEPDQGPSYNYHHKMPSLVSGATTDQAAMRAGNSIEERNIKPSQASASNKRPRFEQRSSLISPFKVRKEKLGDRIAALQQLVAPFGKTDTASVLMEAFGYIKFLQDQIETLSVPYMRSSVSKATEEAGRRGEVDENGKLDLRSRGLCLVPLACTSYMTSDHGGVGGGWSPPDHYQGFG